MATKSTTSSSSSCGPRQHQVVVPFRVRVPDQLLGSLGAPDIACYLVGDCNQLGAWNVEKAKSMPIAQKTADYIEFGRDVQIPLPLGNVAYRFFLARCHNPNDEDSEVTLCISHWESFRNPRRLALMDCLTGAVQPDVDVPEFGVVIAQDGSQQKRIQRGWLTGQTQVHLHLMPGCLEWFRPNYRRAVRTALVSCWSHSIAEGTGSAAYSDAANSMTSAAANNSNAGGGGGSSATLPIQMGELEESLNGDEYLAGRLPATVCSIGESTPPNDDSSDPDADCRTRPQATSGELCTPDSHLVFQVDTFDLESTAFDIELRDPKSRQLIGKASLMPLRSQESKGVKILQVMVSKQGAPVLVGTLKLQYLFITSMSPHLRNDVSVTYRRHWVKRKTMDVGHRGAGNSHKKNTFINTVRENTIHSMNLAASHGADFVEFDVQFSKDNIPVVFHDFNVAVTMRLKQRKLKQIEVPVKNFTMESLQSMKLCSLAEMTDNEEHLDTDDIDPVELQPFPSLRQCLEQVNPDTGFLIEIKYPQKVKGSQLEENVEHYSERNRYVNRILKDVIECGGRRRIVLCTFDADCCTMVQLKQNRYPVLFLTQGRSEAYPPYEDPRCNSTLASMRHALSLGVLGLSASFEELLKEESLVARVQNAGLVLFVWGDGLNDANVKARFRQLGVDALIYDYIHAEKALGSRTVFEQAENETEAATGVAADTSRSSSASPLAQHHQLPHRSPSTASTSSSQTGGCL
ncbi:hypothetical protein BOX15_Mlig000303g1 [Macrostomum lignano]|uniref:Glycerophosphocholine phosphodiesterase n=2 Tax=Macrostomum lignano TaxID=282301 RepID=A0A1I8JE46_9PLAT|nr:hypothetical protein BOX15_Mlig000303g1 [Macrostomum lignano]